jgi:hypothetical protein
MLTRAIRLRMAHPIRPIWIYKMRKPSYSISQPIQRWISYDTKKLTSKKKSGTLKHLFQTYGRTAFIVYMVVSTADLLLCMGGVYLAGTEQVIWLEDKLHHYLPNLPWNTPSIKTTDPTKTIHDTSTPHVEDEMECNQKLEQIWHENMSKTVEEAKRHPTLTSMFVVAYGIHELLTPVRIALTALFTPPVARRFSHVRWLVSRRSKIPSK